MSARSELVNDFTNSMQGVINSGFNAADAVISTKATIEARKTKFKVNTYMASKDLEKTISDYYNGLDDSLKLDFNSYSKGVIKAIDNWRDEIGKSGAYSDEELSWIDSELIPKQKNITSSVAGDVEVWATNAYVTGAVTNFANDLIADETKNLDDSCTEYGTFIHDMGADKLDGVPSADDFRLLARGEKTGQYIKKVASDPLTGFLADKNFDWDSVVDVAMELNGYDGNSTVQRNAIKEKAKIIKSELYNEAKEKATTEIGYWQQEMITRLNEGSFSIYDAMQSFDELQGARLANGEVNPFYADIYITLCTKINDQKTLDEAQEAKDLFMRLKDEEYEAIANGKEPSYFNTYMGLWNAYKETGNEALIPYLEAYEKSAMAETANKPDKISQQMEVRWASEERKTGKRTSASEKLAEIEKYAIDENGNIKDEWYNIYNQYCSAVKTEQITDIYTQATNDRKNGKSWSAQDYLTALEPIYTDKDGNVLPEYADQYNDLLDLVEKEKQGKLQQGVADILVEYNVRVWNGEQVDPQDYIDRLEEAGILKTDGSGAIIWYDDSYANVVKTLAEANTTYKSNIKSYNKAISEINASMNITNWDLFEAEGMLTGVSNVSQISVPAGSSGVGGRVGAFGAEEAVAIGESNNVGGIPAQKTIFELTIDDNGLLKRDSYMSSKSVAYTIKGMPNVPTINSYYEPLIKQICTNKGITYDPESIATYNVAVSVMQAANEGLFTTQKQKTALQELMWLCNNPLISEDEFNRVRNQTVIDGIFTEQELRDYGVYDYFLSGMMEDTKPIVTQITNNLFQTLFNAQMGTGNDIYKNVSRQKKSEAKNKFMNMPKRVADYVNTVARTNPTKLNDKNFIADTVKMFADESVYNAIDRLWNYKQNVLSFSKDGTLKTDFRIGSRNTAMENLTATSIIQELGAELSGVERMPYLLGLLNKDIVQAYTNGPLYGKTLTMSKGDFEKEVSNLSKAFYNGRDVKELSPYERNELELSVLVARMQNELRENVCFTFGYNPDEIHANIFIPPIQNEDGTFIGGGLAAVTTEGYVIMSGGEPDVYGNKWCIGKMSKEAQVNIANGLNILDYNEIQWGSPTGSGTSIWSDFNLQYDLRNDGALANGSVVLGEAEGNKGAWLMPSSSPDGIPIPLETLNVNAHASSLRGIVTSLKNNK